MSLKKLGSLPYMNKKFLKILRFLGKKDKPILRLQLKKE